MRPLPEASGREGAGITALAEARAALPLFERLPQHVGQKADEDVGLDAVRALMPHRANAQLALLDAERRLGVGELDICPPQLVGAPIRHVGAQDIAALAPARPVVPRRLGPPLEAHASPERRVGDKLDNVAAGRSLVTFEQAPDLALEAPHVKGVPGPLHALPQPGQAVLDLPGETLVHRAFFLAPFHGADEHDGLHARGPPTMLGLDSLAHRLPVLGVGDRARPLAEFTLRVPTRYRRPLSRSHSRLSSLVMPRSITQIRWAWP